MARTFCPHLPGLTVSTTLFWRLGFAVRNCDVAVLSSYKRSTTKPTSAERPSWIEKSTRCAISPTEQRQLEIVLGLASDPKILLLDEPAAGLSSGESTEMAEFLMKLDPALAVLLIEHAMAVVFDVADEISVLHFGEVLETGTPEQIKKSPRVQEIYLGTD